MIFTKSSRHICISLLALSLAGCNSTEQVLTVPNTPASDASGTASGVAPTAQASATTAATSAASDNRPINMAQIRKHKLHIAPIIGAPLELITPLSHRIGTIAKTNLIPLTPQNDPTTAYSLKGYFSILSENNETTVLYVWDVVDKSGNRVHRLQGQEKTSNANAHGWSAINPQMMEKIADATMNEYFRWVSAIAS